LIAAAAILSVVVAAQAAEAMILSSATKIAHGITVCKTIIFCQASVNDQILCHEGV